MENSDSNPNSLLYDLLRSHCILDYESATTATTATISQVHYYLLAVTLRPLKNVTPTLIRGHVFS